MMRDLVTGGGCDVSNSSSSQNPLLRLARQMENRQDINNKSEYDRQMAGGPQEIFAHPEDDVLGMHGPMPLPQQHPGGGMFHHQPPPAQFHHFDEIYGQQPQQHHPHPHHPHDFDNIYNTAAPIHRHPLNQHMDPRFAEFDNIYNQPPPSMMQPPPQAAVVPLPHTLRNFFQAIANGQAFEPSMLPPEQLHSLGPLERRKIRDRASIMAKHMTQEDNPEVAEHYVADQLNRLFTTFQIDPAEVAFEEAYANSNNTANIAKGKAPVRQQHQYQTPLDEAYATAGGSSKQQDANSKDLDKWLDEYNPREENLQHIYDEAYRNSTSGGWLEEYENELKQNMNGVEPTGQELAAINSLSDFVQAMANEQDPKWKNSKFMDFIGRMSRGEVGFEDNKVIEKGAYAFDYSENRYANHSSPYEEGLELFRNGMLPEAIEAFEAEIQRNPDHSEAWRELGLTHAENDEDDKAVSALQQALRVNGNNMPAMIAMAVSHANLLNHVQAVDVLRQWLSQHQLYRDLPQPPTIDVEGYHISPHEQCVNMFRAAAQINPDDCDVFVALGVLYNLSMEYDKAIDAFAKALQINPSDYTLWNKLGATQANSSRSADAVDSYRHCLELKPTYVRGWTNMGISHTDQGNYNEAAEYYLGALAANPRAVHVWGYLVTLFHIMDRSDLVDRCSHRDINLFRDEFEF